MEKPSGSCCTTPIAYPAARVYIVEPDVSAREHLVALCASVALTARPFERPGACLEEVDAQSRGCVLMNVWLPEMTGLQFQQALLQREVYLPLVMLTSRPDVATAVTALKHGAFDFLESHCSPQLLLDRIFRAIETDAAKSIERAQVHAVRARLDQLTNRERQILQLLVEGKTTKEAACHLGLTAKTVENHRARIMDKMEARNLAVLLRSVYVGIQRGPLNVDLTRWGSKAEIGSAPRVAASENPCPMPSPFSYQCKSTWKRCSSGEGSNCVPGQSVPDTAP